MSDNHADEADWLRYRDEWRAYRAERAAAGDPPTLPSPLHPDDVWMIANLPCLHWRKVNIWDETGKVGYRWIIDLLADERESPEATAKAAELAAFFEKVEKVAASGAFNARPVDNPVGSGDNETTNRQPERTNHE